MKKFMSLLIVMGLLLSCGNKTDSKSDTENVAGNKVESTTTGQITVAELNDLIESGQDVFLLDVRTIEEYDEGHIGAVDMRIRHDTLEFCLALLPEDKNVPIYSQCRSGKRSQFATDLLIENGYVNAVNVTGGIVAWEEAGYAIVKGEAKEKAKTD